MTDMLLLTSIPVLLGGAVLALALRSNRARAIVAMATQGAALVLVLVGIIPILRGGSPLGVTFPWPAPIDEIAFRVDALGAFFLAWSLPMTLLGTIYAYGYLRADLARGRNGGPHFALLNLIALSFVFIYAAQNTLVFLLGWEIAAVSAWLCVIWDYSSQKIRFAGFNYLVSTHVGLFVLVAAFMLLHGWTSSMDFAAFGAYLSQHPPGRGTIFLLFGIAFALKSAFFPFHTWLPRAHAAAPAHVSALMSGVIHKAGLFAFLRFVLLGGRPDAWMGWAVLLFGAASAIYGVLYTTVQRDLKRLLGYSSTENVGIVAIGFGLGMLGWAWSKPTLVAIGFGAGLLHLVNHAVFKCALFYAAGAIAHAIHSVDLEHLGGLARKLPRTAAVFAVCVFAMAGLPPLNGFASEFLLYTGLFDGSAPSNEADVVLVCAAAALAFVGAVAALSATRAFGLAFLGTPRDVKLATHATARLRDPPRSMMVPMYVHAGLAVAIGVAPELALEPIGAVVSLFALHDPAHADPAILASALGPVTWGCRILAIAVAASLVVAWRTRARARTSAVWGCGYAAGTTRMQYTGSSFSAAFSALFRAALPLRTRTELPPEPFPTAPSTVATHHVDAVEQRMFEVLGQGEQFVLETSSRIPEQSRFAFAAGLVAVVVIALAAIAQAT